MSLVEVAVVGSHIDNTGSTATVSSGERALVQCHFLDGFRLKDGEDAQHMLGIVDGNPIQQEQVLIRPAASDIQAGESFSPTLDAGEQLDCLQDIGFAKERRCALDSRDGNLDGAHLGGGDAGFPLGGYDSLFQRCARDQPHVDGRVFLHLDRDGLRRISYVRVGNTDIVSLSRDGK